MPSERKLMYCLATWGGGCHLQVLYLEAVVNLLQQMIVPVIGLTPDNRRNYRGR